MQVREADKAYREARSAVRTADKLLLDPPPTDKLVLHVRWADLPWARLACGGRVPSWRGCLQGSVG